MKTYSQAAAVLIAIGFALPLVAPAQAAPTGTDVATARAAEQQVQTSLTAIQNELSALSQKSTQLQLEAQSAEAEAEEAGRKVIVAQDAAIVAQERAEQAKEKVDSVRAEMAMVAQAMYRDSASAISSAYYLLDADSFKAANDRDRAYQEVMKHADAQAADFKTLSASAATLQKQADAQLARSEELAQAANEASQAAQAAAEAAEAQVAAADQRRAELAEQLAKAKHTTAQAEAAYLAQVEADRKAKIAAAAASEKARQEAAQRQAAAAAAAQTSQPSTPTQSSSSGQALRDQIVNYAVKYDGYRYVFGTSGPNTFDCSGFVKFIYGKYGYNLAHSADAQGRTGRRISASEARPGDLVWWPGRHIMIYMGGNRTFGANNPSKGVTYSQLYGSYVFIRLVE